MTEDRKKDSWINNENKKPELTGYATTKIISENHQSIETKDRLLCEHRLILKVNGEGEIRVNCTGTDLEELCTGLMFARGWIKEVLQIDKIELQYGADETHAFAICCGAKPEKEAEPDTVGMKPEKEAEPDAVDAKPEKEAGKGAVSVDDRSSQMLHPEQVFALTDRFQQYKGLHEQTSGTHLCMLAYGGAIVFVTEDISRHNAIDKAVGYSLLHRLDRTKCVLFSSGRIQEDTVHKVLSAGIRTLVSKSAPTLKAVETAQAAGLCLIGRAWNDEYRIYAGGKND